MRRGSLRKVRRKSRISVDYREATMGIIVIVCVGALVMFGLFVLWVRAIIRKPR